MKTNRIPLILAALAVTHLNAEPGRPPIDRPPVDRRPPPILLLGALDADKNGELSADEILNSSAALGELDKDGDGALSRKEIAPPPPKGRKPEGPPPPKGPLPPEGPPPPKGSPVLLKALDLDEDGVLSAVEIEDAPLSLNALDANDDGSITRDELKPARPPVTEPT